jgi:hypothetical protein
MNTHTKQFETTTQNGEEGIVHHKTHIYSNSKPLRSVILVKQYPYTRPSKRSILF